MTPAVIPCLSINTYIYIFEWGKQALFRLDYSEGAEAWQSMSDWSVEQHGDGAYSVASRDTLFLVGKDGYGDPSKSVSRYNPSLDYWEKLADKPTASSDSALLCTNQFLSCIGGRDEVRDWTNRVERMDLETLEWAEIAKLNRKPTDASHAVEFKGKIYAFWEDDSGLFAESYDPKADKWIDIEVDDPEQTIPKIRSERSIVAAYKIDECLYLVGKQKILRYDVEENNLSNIMSYPELNVWDTVVVNTYENSRTYN